MGSNSAKQTVAIVKEQGQPAEFVHDYPVGSPGHNEVLAKVLYSGVCQSDLHTKLGTATGADGKPITNIKLPHVGGHEGIGRILQLGPGCSEDVQTGRFVGIRFASRICRRCEFCLAGKEQYCPKATNHLHHEDGSFQQYIVLDADNLTLLPDDIDPVVMGPVLCAGVTAYKAVKNAHIKPGEWVVISGAGGGLGHLAVQYARAFGARVIGIDGGSTQKKDYVLSLGAEHYLDFTAFSPPELIAEVRRLTSGGAAAAVVTAGSSAAFTCAASMLRIEGCLSCCGIPPPSPDGKDYIATSIAEIVIKGLRIQGNLTGSLKECLEAVDLVRMGMVKPEIKVRKFEELEDIYREMEQGKIVGRIVVKVVDDE
ncbi:putative alcohol dehydrogenase [Phaeomoniella chlamydospora]|uniref:Putative alcohol dehydrogenase n=1 Tax=Phaeomoniella chlamydospora TaxID=158046 RepID=A0A0G2GVH4_PHACM|nr:putative alcohol dehydrogenase [Phaeomoniella chlamydospora]